MVFFSEIVARENWLKQFQELEYMQEFLAESDPYWIESIQRPFYGNFSLEEIDDEIWYAAKELHKMSLELVDYVCTSEQSDLLMTRLKIPVEYREAVCVSWQRQDPSLYGRFDFAFDENMNLKLLEYNADTPTCLYESSIWQWLWIEDNIDRGYFSTENDQFNSIHESLISRFSKLGIAPIHFACVQDNAEDLATVRYLQLCALEANVQPMFVYMEDIGHDEDGDIFDVDLNMISSIFKLYPWEDWFYEDLLQSEKSGKLIIPRLVLENKVSFLEPIWKCILSNKGILPLMWEMFGNHHIYKNYLLEAYSEDYFCLESDYLTKFKNYVRKSLFGREGQNVEIIDPEHPSKLIDSRSGDYGYEGYIVQERTPLMKYNNYNLIMGAWLVGNEPCGINIRADKSLITGDRAIFVPHVINPNL